MSIFEGRLLTFHKDPYRRIPAFLSGDGPRGLIWIGGIGDNFFSVTYLPRLIDELGGEWTIVQAILPSSFQAYGGQDHHRDSEDLDDLLDHLVKKLDMREFALFASSTGVQTLLELLQRGRHKDLVTRVIVQGIVTDPKSAEYSAVSMLQREEAAKELVDKNQKEVLVPELYDLPMTAARLASGGYPTLQEALWGPALNGDVRVLKDVLGRIRCPLLVMIAMHSQFRVTKDQQQQFETAVKANSLTPEVFLTYFNDTSDENRRMLCAAEGEHTAAVVLFLREQDAKRRQREEAVLFQEQEAERKSKSVLANSSFQHRIA